jgi:hypothetical protein
MIVEQEIKAKYASAIKARIDSPVSKIIYNPDTDAQKDSKLFDKIN